MRAGVRVGVRVGVRGGLRAVRGRRIGRRGEHGDALLACEPV